MFNIATLPAPSVDAGLSKYLDEIRKFPILKPEQELAYALPNCLSDSQTFDAAPVDPSIGPMIGLRGTQRRDSE